MRWTRVFILLLLAFGAQRGYSDDLPFCPVVYPFEDLVKLSRGYIFESSRMPKEKDPRLNAVDDSADSQKGNNTKLKLASPSPVEMSVGVTGNRDGTLRFSETYLFASAERVFHVTSLIEKEMNGISPQGFDASADLGDQLSGTVSVKRAGQGTTFSADHFFRFLPEKRDGLSSKGVFPMIGFSAGGQMVAMTSMEEILPELEKPYLGFSRFFLRTEGGIGEKNSFKFSSHASANYMYQVSVGMETLFRQNATTEIFPAASFHLLVNFD